MSRQGGPTWYLRLSEVPEIGYVGPPSIDRARLPGHDARPRIETSNYDGRRSKIVMWPGIYDDNGQIVSVQHPGRDDRWTSASPATQYSGRRSGRRQPGEAKPTGKELLQDLFETLELPGQLDDYHSAISLCCHSLWTLRREGPWVSASIERLCLLDIRLLEAYPGFLKEAHPELYSAPSFPMHYPAFEQLVRLYEREGCLLEAMDVAGRASRLGQGEELVELLRERIEALRAEEKEAGAR